MKELIRFQNVRCDLGNGHRLSNYNLTIFQGEIVYIQGISGSGKSALEFILTGQTSIQEGTLYVDEKPWTGRPSKLPFEAGIYTIGIRHPMVGKLPIVDNLEAIKKVKYTFSLYREKSAYKNTADILDKFQIHEKPETPVHQLTFLEEQLLCVAKAVMRGARLIILNCVSNIYGDQDAVELCKYMRRLSQDGVAFLIISEKPTPFLDIADKIQIVHHGIDLKEWNSRYYNRAMLYEYAARPESICEAPHFRGKLVCILDFYWDSKDSVFLFLKDFKNKYPDVWHQYMPSWEPAEGVFYDGAHVIIPHDSGETLLVNMSIADNLSICIPGRAGRFGGQVIHKGMRFVLVNDFYKMAGLRTPVKYLDELNTVEKKILSIYRWELAHPKCIFLENPFWGMDTNESAMLRNYLNRVRGKGIDLILFTKDKGDVCGDEDFVMTTEEAKRG